ncbi:hypothetical protein [Fodinicurvata halophila]|uniref:hypothetical protein n=1 Tax=Fodinicurvata halophila TaxID=1419723 RepID=UPI00363707CA
MNAAYIVEAWRQAQEEFGEGEVMNREQTNWAWNQLTITEERTAELGMEGLMPPVNVTCRDHEGGGLALIQQWDGEQWNALTEFMEPDRDRVEPMYRESAEAFAEDNGIPIKDCD